MNKEYLPCRTFKGVIYLECLISEKYIEIKM